MKSIFVSLLILAFSVSMFAQELITSHNILDTRLSIQLEEHSENVEIIPSFEKKSVGLALLYSFLLPGMGELYAGDYSFGKYLTIADGVFWGTVAGLNLYENWQRDNYKSFAKSNAGVNPEGKDEIYFANVGAYLNIGQYNRELELAREFNDLYDENTHYWYWQSNGERREYREMWLSSESASNNIRFAVGALVLNRVVSMINSARLVNKHNNREEKTTLNISFDYQNRINLPNQFKVNFHSAF
ncbi:MAG: hypothetical protein K9J12_15510 [Melioribacteraceae bacterium]|nr:hypothetical protein [Melioribacteraceae bacterium]MCF8265309.1 hypothetical protein [Melioribacteraceae bacterium]MCF8412765.1 hypothetical protein [Melioribacteraceae bacterium]